MELVCADGRPYVLSIICYINSLQSRVEFLLCLAIGLRMASGAFSLLNQRINLMVNYFTVLSSLSCLLFLSAIKTFVSFLIISSTHQVLYF